MVFILVKTYWENINDLNEISRKKLSLKTGLHQISQSMVYNQQLPKDKLPKSNPCVKTKSVLFNRLNTLNTT